MVIHLEYEVARSPLQRLLLNSGIFFLWPGDNETDSAFAKGEDRLRRLHGNRGWGSLRVLRRPVRAPRPFAEGYQTVMHSKGNQLDPHVILSHLEWALQALALPAEDQASLFPDAAHPAYEFILDFDHWYLVSLSDIEDAFSPEQKSALEALDRRLDEAANLSTDGEMLNTPEWEGVRSRARKALDAFGWSLALPPSDRREYIPSEKKTRARRTR